MGLFSKKKESFSTVDECKKFIESFFVDMGAVPEQHQFENENKWFLKKGSAMIFISIGGSEDFFNLRIVSPILFAPEKNLLAFFRRCLEINMELVSCAIGVFDDTVALVHERPINGIDKEEVNDIIENLSNMADDLDDDLAKEYGAKLYSEGKS